MIGWKDYYNWSQSDDPRRRFTVVRNTAGWYELTDRANGGGPRIFPTLTAAKAAAEAPPARPPACLVGRFAPPEPPAHA